MPAGWTITKPRITCWTIPMTNRSEGHDGDEAVVHRVDESLPKCSISLTNFLRITAGEDMVDGVGVVPIVVEEGVIAGTTIFHTSRQRSHKGC